ncbi:hypothetical protein [Ornithinibacillus bavariensis]|nr:hypothetical protein [Ornithinibacillus bavariensis]
MQQQSALTPNYQSLYLLAIKAEIGIPLMIQWQFGKYQYYFEEHEAFKE